MEGTNQLLCPFCDMVFPKHILLKTHFKKDHSLNFFAPLEQKIKCKMCEKSFGKVIFLSRHMLNAHYIHNDSINATLPQKRKREDEFEGKFRLSNSLDYDSYLCEMVAKLRLTTTMTGSDLGLVMESVGNMLTNIMQKVQQNIIHFMKQYRVDANDQTLQLFLDQLLCNPKDMSNLKSMRGQINALKKSYDYIDPIPLPLGSTTTYDNLGNKNVDEPLTEHVEIQYVSLIEIIKLVFSNDEVINFNKNKRSSSDDILTSFEDGEIYKEHPFFKKHENAIGILLYFDEFLTNNPIGSKTKLQKLGGFYISFMNLPEHLRDYIGNVHPIAIAKNADIKKFGIDQCLNGFMLELKKLESDTGVLATINGKTCTLRATLVGVVADTLAAHEIFGFMGPSAKYFCRMCTMTNEERRLFPLIDTELRTREMHDSYVTKLQQDENIENIKGVNRNCILHMSAYFHCTDNFVFDIMHDVLEGQAARDITLVLTKFIVSPEYKIDLTLFNKRIKNFQYGPIDSKNKPSPIIAPTAKTIKLKQRAVQTWCLLRIFPFLVSDKVAPNDPYLQHIININKINEIIFAPKIPKSKLTYLQELIDHHIQKYQELFPDQAVINKLMHMRHYPLCIQKSGPLRHLSCFKYEAKHYLFIKYGKVCCNYKNISKSMMNISQISQCAIWGAGKESVRKKFTYSSYEEPMEEDIYIIIKYCEPHPNIQEYKIIKSINIYGKYYEKDLFVALKADDDKNNNMPLFGRIIKIIMNNNNVFFYYEKYKTAFLNEALNAYKINKTSYYDVVNYSNLKDDRALSEWQDTSGSSYICLLHMIC